MVGDEKNLVNLSFLYQKTMDKGAAKELIEYFINNVQFFLNESNLAIERKEFSALYKFAQKIETGAKHIYSEKIIDIASDIEFSSLENDFDRASFNLQLLDEAVNDLKNIQKVM